MTPQLFDSLIGPVLFAAVGGAYGYVKRPEQRGQLLLALVTLFVTAGILFALFPSPQLFGLLAPYGGLVTALCVLDLLQMAGGRSAH